MAIDSACEGIYGTSEPLGHFAPPIPTIFSGDGPDGVSVYRGPDHLHYVSYGFSQLHYDAEAAGQEFSGKGMELCFRLRSDERARDDLPLWPIAVMQNLYRYLRESERWFEPNQAVPTTTGPINSELTLEQSVITGLFCAEDPELGAINTPHGGVQFILLVGMTLAEAEAFQAGDHEVASKLDALRTDNPLLITDMARGLV